MSYYVLKCPSCGAQLTSENYKTGRVVCDYCGAEIREQDDNHFGADIKYTYHKVDDAESDKAKADRDIKIKEMEFRDKADKRGYFFLIIPFVVMLLPLAIMNLPDFLESQKAKMDGKIIVGTAEEDFEKENYKVVESTLKAAGFTNFEFIDLGDFFFKDKVKSVSIKGNSDFSADDYFYSDDKVVITYH